MTPELATVIEPRDLHQHHGHPDMLIIDLSSAENYATGHIPGAVHLEYRQLVLGHPPAPGLMPPIQALQSALTGIGLTPASRVVAYDDSGGGKACRLLWTLDVVGHPHGSLLNGGAAAWAGAGYPLSTEVFLPDRGAYPMSYASAEHALATRESILGRLGDEDFRLLDARTPEEYAGASIRAARGGHIPGAVNLNWLDTVDRHHHARFLPHAELEALLRNRGIQPDQEVVCYCQTNHRSAHSYIMLKHLGFPRIKAYAGSWSEWGNDADTPVEL